MNIRRLFVHPPIYRPSDITIYWICISYPSIRQDHSLHTGNIVRKYVAQRLQVSMRGVLHVNIVAQRGGTDEWQTCPDSLHKQWVSHPVQA